MSMVLDASLTMARFHANEITNEVLKVYAEVNLTGAWVPPLWQIEVANVLQSNVRKGRYDVSYRDQTLKDLAQLNISVDAESPDHLWSTTVDLAYRHRLTVYDAIYLELALRRNLPLATHDTDLRAAATREGDPLLGL